MAAGEHARPAPTALRSAIIDSGSDMAGAELHHVLPNSVWVSRAMVVLQTFAVPLAFWFKPVCVCVALFWLVYRAYQVVYKPLDELAALLGFDLPVTPVVDLASIKADGAVVHWSLPEKPKNKTKLKFEIHLNGNVVDNVPVHESAVTITGLQPSSFYVVRLALVNEAEFGSRSAPIRFRTRPASSGEFFGPGIDAHEDHDGSGETLPHVRLYRGLKDITSAAIEATPMTREPSSGTLGPKRSVTGRRPSPAALGLESKHDPQSDDGEAPEGAESIAQLTQKLDVIRRDTDEAERLAKDEEEEELRLKEELAHERDTLKADATEKEKASRNLKREVNTLERQNTAAQNERSKHERLLQQKKQERQKLKDDILNWQREAEAMKAEVARVRKEKSQHLRRIEMEKEELRTRQAEEASALRTLDDEIKEKSVEIKKLERAMKNNTPDGTEPEQSIVQQFQQEAEEERNWHLHRGQLQQQYAMSVQKLEAAKRFHNEQARYLESVRATRRRDEDLAQQFSSPPPAPEHRPIRRGDSQRSRRVPSGHSTSDSPRLGVFAPNPSQSPFGNALTSVAPSAFSSAPFLNIHNGMTIPGPTNDLPMSDEDRERLTGGALMSPGAGAELLPADLFSGDGENRNSPQHVLPLPGLGSLPGLPGLPPPPSSAYMMQDHLVDLGPASPASASSRSPSVFASPQASQNNLHLGSPEHVMDADRRSVRSTRSTRATSSVAAGSRFSSMFGIKPRVKPTSASASADAEDGLALGKAQSHSMPRQDQGIPGLDSATRKRNSSLSGTLGMDPDLGGLHDGTADTGVDPPGSGGAGASRRRHMLGMASIFGRDKEGGWPSSFTSFARRPGSPRPGSTHSNELPRPSMDSSRWGVDAWPSAGDAAAGARSSPLSFNHTNWPMSTGSSTCQPLSQQQQQQQQQQVRPYGSRHPSRRPSVQYGASGPPEDIMEDSDSDALDRPELEPQLAPIGTKPSSASPGGKRPVRALHGEESMEIGDFGNLGMAPKLNPAAKDFKSFFGIKSKEKDKSGAAAASSSSAAATPIPPGSASSASQPYPSVDFPPSPYDDHSPPVSRKSRDARSTTGTESSFAGGESLRSSHDLVRLGSYSGHSFDSPGLSITGGSGAGSSVGKESFMQKISRKSSSGKFSLPAFVSKQREKGRLDASLGSPTLLATPGWGGEEEGEEQRDGTVAGLGNRGSGRSWSAVLKLGKSSKGATGGGGGGGGGGGESVSGVSLASGTTEEEDE